MKQVIEPRKQELRKMSREDYLAMGVDLYGIDTKKWRFRCVQCKQVQTAQDFIDLGIDPEGIVHFSCIGRWDKSRGCDWTLGGLLRIHNLEIVMQDEKGNEISIPVFEFADDIQSEDYIE